jgi:hypothetical protein
VESAIIAQLKGRLAAPAEVEPVLAPLTPPLQARARARIGAARLAVNDRPGAENELRAAAAALGKIDPTDEFVIPGMKDAPKMPSGNRDVARAQAVALAEMARLEAGLGQKDQAWRHVLLALGVLRSTAPSIPGVEAKLADFKKRGASAISAEIQRSLNLKDPHKAQDIVKKYREALKQFFDLAQSRLSLEIEILESAIESGNAGEVWNEISQRIAAAEADRSEPYMMTPLPWLLARNFESAGDKATIEKISKAVGSAKAPPAAELETLASRIGEPDAHSIVKAMQAVKGAATADRERAVLAAASRLVRNDKLKEAIQFVRLFDDQLLREESLQWAAALACRRGHAPTVKENFGDASFVPTEAVSAWRGFLLGLAGYERAHPSAPASKSEGVNPPEPPKRL